MVKTFEDENPFDKSKNKWQRQLPFITGEEDETAPGEILPFPLEKKKNREEEIKGEFQTRGD